MNDRMNEMRFDTCDKLNRKNQAIKISRLLKNSEYYSRDGEGLIVALNSSWGTGKTMFLKMWENEINADESDLNDFPLNKNDANTLYYNAWENDDYENALIPMIAQFNKIFRNVLIKENLKNRTMLELSDIIKKWSNFSMRLILTAGKNIVKKKFGLENIDIEKIYNSGVFPLNEDDLSKYFEIDNQIDNLDIDKIDEYLEQLGDEVKTRYEKIKAAIEPAIFDDFEKLNKIKNEFRKILALISEDKKLIVFVDELDRCRPSYAIELLERIKHFFNVPNVIFVLSVDIEQLSHSIATIYGEKMDAEGYLMRFIDMQFRLPSPKVEDYCNFINTNSRENAFEEKYLNAIIKIFKELRLSLRDMDKMFVNIKIFYDGFEKGFDIDIDCFNFYCFMCTLKYINFQKYKIVMESNISNEYAMELFSSSWITKILKPFLDGNNNKTLKDIAKENIPGFKVYAEEDEISARLLAELKTGCDFLKYFEFMDAKLPQTYDLTFSQYVERQLEFVFGE